MIFFVRSLLLLMTLLSIGTASFAAAPKILFDEAHGQQFLLAKEGPLDLSQLAGLYQAGGYTVTSSAEMLTSERLASVDVLVISGPFRTLSTAEVAAVLDFVSAGGGLAVMLHIAPPLRSLLHRLEVDFTNGTIREESSVIDGNAQNFRVTALADHPVTKGLPGFSLYGAWALRGTATRSKILAFTGQRAWVDLNGDKQLSPGDAVQSFGVMVAGELGRGRYVVLGDDAIFQNRFLDADNRQLALQLLRWLASR